MGLKRSDNVSTIHAACYRLLNLSPGCVMNASKIKVFCEDAGIDMGTEGRDQTEYDEYLSMVQLSRNLRVDLDEAYAMRGGTGSLSKLYTFSETYRNWKTTYGAVDFDDMLEKVLDSRLHLKATRLIIDEAQDLSPLQWQVMDLFSTHRSIKQVYVAGDDDQSIHGWAGADIHGMRKFEERFCGEREILSQSWRVPRAVHSVAVGIIKRVSNRVEKEYKPRDADGHVEMVGDVDISNLIKGNEPYMVLARTNFTLKGISGALREGGIAYAWQGEGGSWKRDAGLSIRIWKKMCRGEDISQREYATLCKVLTQDTKKAINNKRSDIYKKNWTEVMVLPEEAMDQVHAHGEGALTEIPSVELCTIHASKGRECDNVILVTELTDRVRETLDSDPDSEARVFYVGATRAINSLTIFGGHDGYNIY